MKSCPHCEHPIEDSARFCIYCATSLDEKKIWAPRRRRPRLYRALALACVAALTVSAVWLWPRDPLPLSDTVSESAPVEDNLPAVGTTLENGTSGTTAPSSAAGSTTLTTAPTTTTTTKKGLLSFIDNLFGKNTTTTTTTAAATTTTTAPTPSTTTIATTTTTTPTIPTTANSSDRVPIETPAGISHLIGERFYARDTVAYRYDTEGLPYDQDVYDLYIEIVEINCYLAPNPDVPTDQLHPYMDFILWIPPSEYEVRRKSNFMLKTYKDNGGEIYKHLFTFNSDDEIKPNQYVLKTVDCDLVLYSGSYHKNLLNDEWEIDRYWSDFTFVPLGSQGI